MVTRVLPPLHDSYTKNPACPEGDEFVMILHRFARKYGTRDIMEEYHCVSVCPLLDGCAVSDDAWAADIGGIPCPNWMKFSGFTLACEFLCPSLIPSLRAWLACCLGLPNYHFYLFVRSAEEEKGGVVTSSLSLYRRRNTRI